MEHLGLLSWLLAVGGENAYGGNSLGAAKTALTVLCLFPSNQLMKLKNNKGTGVERTREHL